MRFLIIGDLHGRVRQLAQVDEWASRNNISYVIQVGDFGISWPDPPESCKILHYFTKRERQSRSGPIWLAVLGNHDNYNKFDKLSEIQLTIDPTQPFITYAPGLLIARRPVYIPFIETLFCGGAVSIDAHNRRQDLNWWANEAPSRIELEVFFDLMEQKKPKYVISHDGPEIAHRSRGNGINPLSGLPFDYVARNFQNAWEISSHKPTAWFFGHHHTLKATKTDSTSFHCSGFHGQGWLISQSKILPFDINSGGISL